MDTHIHTTKRSGQVAAGISLHLSGPDPSDICSAAKPKTPPIGQILHHPISKVLLLSVELHRRQLAAIFTLLYRRNDNIQMFSFESIGGRFHGNGHRWPNEMSLISIGK